MTLTSGVPQPLLMELPKYQLPVLWHLLMNLWERAKFFLERAGTIILYSTIGLWVLAQYPKKPVGGTEPDIYYSFAGKLGHMLHYVFAPQCFATLATVRRETNSWGWTGFLTGYLFALAYLAALIVNNITLLLLG